jgi:hypothetical protein
LPSIFSRVNGFVVPPGPSQENDMANPNTERRAIGLLVVFATLLTLIAVWKLPEMPELDA